MTPFLILDGGGILASGFPVWRCRIRCQVKSSSQSVKGNFSKTLNRHEKNYKQTHLGSAA